MTPLCREIDEALKCSQKSFPAKDLSMKHFNSALFSNTLVLGVMAKLVEGLKRVLCSKASLISFRSSRTRTKRLLKSATVISNNPVHPLEKEVNHGDRVQKSDRSFCSRDVHRRTDLRSRATAQDKYPSRAIEYIVPWGPGGGADQLARKSGVLLEKILNVPLPVINVPGATGGTGITKMLAAPADGQSIAIYIADSHAVLATGATWKMSDIVPVARMILAPSFLFVAADSRFKSWADFEKRRRRTPANSRWLPSVRKRG